MRKSFSVPRRNMSGEGTPISEATRFLCRSSTVAIGWPLKPTMVSPCCKPVDRRRATRFHFHDQHTAVVRQFVKSNDARMERHVLASHTDRAAPDVAVLDQPTRDEMRGVARDGEADSLGRQDDRGVHADDFARAVQKRTAGIPGIQGRIGLDDLVHQTAGLGTHRASERADDSGSHSLLKSIRRTDRDRDLPNRIRDESASRAC